MTIADQHKTKDRPGGDTLRVGLFGGTFNPVHLAHVRIAEDVKAGFDLDKILVVPSAIPPHKKTPEIIRAEDRLEMVNICFKDKKNFEVSDIELQRTGPSFTYDTVKQILDDFEEKINLFLMIGSDAFLEIHTWYKYDFLLDLVGLIVMTRPDNNMNDESSKKSTAGKYLLKKIDAGYRWNEINKGFSHPIKKQIVFYDVTQLSISSTIIRKYIKEDNNTSEDFLHNGVTEYIKKKGLYK